MQDLPELTKCALRRIAKSVVIVATRWEAKRYAMAATAVVGLSLDPPSLLLCVNKTASLTTPLSGGARFAVNLLGRDHLALPISCSAPYQGEERFERGCWGEWGEVPILEDAQAIFVCAPELLTPYGTHNVIIGRVDAVRLCGELDPLIYVDQGYYGTAILESNFAE